MIIHLIVQTDRENIPGAWIVAGAGGGRKASVSIEAAIQRKQIGK